MRVKRSCRYILPGFQRRAVLGALALLTVYGLGAGIPLLAIAYSSRHVSSF